MQQQFKGSEKSSKAEQKQTNEKSINLIKQLLKPSQITQPSNTLITQLKQIQESTKAYYYYLQKLKKKSFNQLYYEDYQFQFALLEKVFYKFKLARLETKINKTQIICFFNRLKLIKNHSLQQKQSIQKAQHHRNTNLTKFIFSQWIQLVKISKKYKIVQNIIKDHRYDEFMKLLIERKHKNIRILQNQNQTNQIIIKIHQSGLLNKYFNAILFHNKIIKLQRTKMKKHYKKFIIKAQLDKKQTLELINKFKLQQTIRLKRQVLQSFQSNKIQKQCEQWYKYQLIRSFFTKWKQYHSQQKDQKQIQTSNEIILRHFLQNKSKQTQSKILINYFNFWKSWSLIQKNRKKQQNIFKSFAQLKQRQLLERKYFQRLKIYKNYQKARQFYQLHIKVNVLQAFKLNIVKQSNKLQNFFKFVQNRNIKKYFERIRIYNLIEKQKLTAFLLKKYWAKFTLTIAMFYFEKTQKAKGYHNTLLKFKSILVLKKNVQFQRRACFFAYQLNILKPLKRWHQRFKIRKFLKLKQLIIQKKILFQWKLETIRKNPNHNKSNPIQSEPSTPTQPCNQIAQTSFFKKLPLNQSDDQIQNRVNQVLKKINHQRTKQKVNSNKILEGEMIRVPTWSTPGTDYNVSVFQDQ